MNLLEETTSNLRDLNYTQLMVVLVLRVGFMFPVYYSLRQMQNCSLGAIVIVVPAVSSYSLLSQVNHLSHTTSADIALLQLRQMMFLNSQDCPSKDYLQLCCRYYLGFADRLIRCCSFESMDSRALQSLRTMNLLIIFQNSQELYSI